MKRVLLLGLVLAASAPAPVVPAVPGQGKITGDGYTVTVQGLTKQSSPGTRDLFEYKYDYDFKGRDDLYIPGLGSVPPKGSFTYRSYEPRIIFMDRAAGNHLLDIVPHAPVVGGSAADVPSVTDFPKEARTGHWTPASDFPGVAQEVIQTHFPAGFVTQEVSNTNYYITGYASLVQPDVQLKSEISVMISQPYNLNGDEVEYHLQFIARDRPRLSSEMRYGSDRSQSTVNAAVAFVNGLIAELKAPPKSPQKTK
jgi:hypothetical protein